MGQRVRNQEQVMEGVDLEKAGQPAMDRYYKSLGLTPDRSEFSKEWDLKIIGSAGERKVEEKYRRKDWGDILVELFQAVETFELGWYYTENPDILAYIILPEMYGYWIAWEKFKRWFAYSYLKENKSPECKISPKGIGISLNIAVPVREIPVNMIERIELCTPWSFY